MISKTTAAVHTVLRTSLELSTDEFREKRNVDLFPTTTYKTKSKEKRRKQTVTL
ncbi:hypothetical protein DPMN_165781 [Dreissena polymorpha]|uniref:Uncharacterized protein n=1 Tax=Dreissena polymorpha TaxID=45954 RepID=A0A9D4IWR8_DREPO|nr:hypothetical protein DPMN_165781 [Dreissena polymorpha]